MIGTFAWSEGRPDEVTLHAEPLALVDAAAAWAAILELPDARGWVCRPHRVEAWPGGEPFGTLLSAEVVGSDGRTLHVRRCGRELVGWRLWETEGGEHARFRESRVSTEGGRHLHYAVYWRLEDQDGVPVYRQHAARFTGWEGA